MAVNIYRLPNKESLVSTGDMSNPIKWDLANTTEAKILDQRLFLAVDNVGVEQADGVLSSVDKSGSDESSWYKFAADVEGVAGTYGDTLEFTIDGSGETPFWIRLYVPEGIQAEPKTDLKILLSYILTGA